MSRIRRANKVDQIEETEYLKMIGILCKVSCKENQGSHVSTSQNSVLEFVILFILSNLSQNSINYQKTNFGK